MPQIKEGGIIFHFNFVSVEFTDGTLLELRITNRKQTNEVTHVTAMRNQKEIFRYESYGRRSKIIETDDMTQQDVAIYWQTALDYVIDKLNKNITLFRRAYDTLCRTRLLEDFKDGNK